MDIYVTAIDATHWGVSTTEDAQSPIGKVERLATGYLTTRLADNHKIKRFRLIDSLNETFGEEHKYKVTMAE